MAAWLGALFNTVRVPGLVQPFRHYDGKTGQVISLRTTPRYSVLTVGDKEFYFIRESGKYDGIGERQSELDLSNLKKTDYTVDCIEG